MILKFAAKSIGRRNFSLLDCNRPQTESDTFMLGHIARSIHSRQTGLHAVIDNNAAVGGNAGGLRQFHVGPDAGAGEKNVGRDLGAILQSDRTYTTVAVAG